jgi:uncharacterized protein YjbI with pentapeptide repeats
MKKFILVILGFPLAAFSANQNDLEKLKKMEQPQILQMDLSNTDLRSYVFTPGKIDLQRANLSHSNLSGVELSKMNLGGADLSYADLSNAKLNQVNLADANLDHANLTGAQMQQTDLSRVNLNFANLTSANLQQAILTKADLTCANLNQADLSKANFSEATISGATFVNTKTGDILGYESIIETKTHCAG